jgi:hypothetical protein
MRRQLMILLLSSVAVGCGSGAAAALDDIRVLPKEITVEEGGSLVTGRGRWQQEREVAVSRITKLNAVRIACDKTTMQCHEAISMITTPVDRLATSGLLMTVQFTYEVTSWGSIIEAAAHPRASDERLTIDLKASTATRVSVETDARGAKVTHTPVPERWVLQ